ncbi:hypothetical protein [Adhaeretor mobilis]|uniref:Uncharacterized protein n=1 Tax=Adhaeretor mobilis TaxID=1930276 RepID=A0A517MPX9_9BACT|nr:hypothetical protein [Adhaeretor mobilis]QDS96938.1 hypothetical protein HG15A2_01970 [Adhaeretor mobilis]
MAKITEYLEQEFPTCEDDSARAAPTGIAFEQLALRASDTIRHSIARVSLLSLLMLLPLSGCMVCQYAKRTVLNEPSAYSWRSDRKRSVKVYRSWAEQAWADHGGSACGAGVSDAYETGFKDGFVDYVYAGGSGEPPAIPPRKYWNVGVRSSGGSAEATDWFAGFRSGSQVAHNEGYREQALVPASAFLGPQENCWDGPPRSIDSFSPPVPEHQNPTHQNPEFLLPGQLESSESSEGVAPTLPLGDSSSEEEMPVPGGSSPKSIPPARSDSPSIPESNSPEPDPDVDELFDARAADLDSLRPNRIRQAKFTVPIREASKRQQGVAAFSAAVRAASKPNP